MDQKFAITHIHVGHVSVNQTSQKTLMRDGIKSIFLRHELDFDSYSGII